MKKLLATCLSAFLAVGTLFAAAPAQEVWADGTEDLLNDTHLFVYADGSTSTTVDNSKANMIVANFFSHGNINVDSVVVSGETVKITNVSHTEDGGMMIQPAANGYTFIFDGNNTLGNMVPLSNCNFTLDLTAGSSLTLNYLTGSGVMNVMDGVEGKYGSVYTAVIDMNEDTIVQSQVVSVESGVFLSPVRLGYIDSDENYEHAVQYRSCTFSRAANAPSSGSSMSAAEIMAMAQAATGGNTSSSAVASTPVETAKATPDMSANSSIDKATVKTSANGTAKISNIKSDAESIEIDSTVEVNGVSYKVKTLGKGALKSCDEVKTVTVPASVNKFEEGAFTGADNLKTVKINTKKAVKVEKGAFDGLNTSKMTIKVSKKMSNKEFAKLQKNLTKAGYKGKVTRSL